MKDDYLNPDVAPLPPGTDVKFLLKGIVQPKKRGVERSSIPTVLTSYTITDLF
jgi:hypothetical protein